MKKVVIVGSSRNDGDTANLTKKLIEKSKWDLVNLNDYEFSYFDYKHENRNDDYLNLMKEIIEKYETLIFVTPIYWYSMSGIMKVFFDRFTDLLTIEKELGRKLRGKKMAVMSCSVGENLGENFWLPFSETAKYLGMKYVGNSHTIAGEKNELKITDFIKQIEK
ncbi:MULTISPECIES: flavodoxin family protein [unclassified Cellulophaga]|uniref:flavodoxin family protein n=1 Tax=unclassified Cellulophaga TaxID=2634405 RepID=UPI0026E2B1A0|nr:MULTISPECIES: NAD(P)H-dependent oxidoreductase [unclassified Cellulophaga]MDO6489913.1 NAD(P)H-dependent oxidoreductase [Cellulophaga sp. 2_MG-2023]MDO6494893.1 NAD(P)H-dependent oxidoreductase [Cellulophaga sp. 3_MG-2023]